MAFTNRLGISSAVALVLILACTRPASQANEARGPCGEMDATPAEMSAPTSDQDEGSAVASEDGAGERTLALPMSTEPAPSDDETTVAPGINDDYIEAKTPKRLIDRLERHGREVHDQKKRILRELAIEPGMTVADIGAGTGLFTLDMAKAVGHSGKVYAVEIAPTLLDHLAKKADKAGFDNVITVQAEARDAKLPGNAVDLALMSDVYHHIEYPRTYMKTVLEGLRPGGVLFVIDFNRIEGKSDPWRLEHVRADQNTVREEIEDVGFELVEERPPLKEHYILEFRRPAKGESAMNVQPIEAHGAIL